MSAQQEEVNSSSFPIVPIATIAIAVGISFLSKKVTIMGVLGKVHAAVIGLAFGSSPKIMKNHFYQLADTLIDGTPITMKRYQGDVLCVVNVASK